jgi:hypothetical protein
VDVSSYFVDDYMLGFSFKLNDLASKWSFQVFDDLFLVF